MIVEDDYAIEVGVQFATDIWVRVMNIDGRDRPLVVFNLGSLIRDCVEGECQINGILRLNRDEITRLERMAALLRLYADNIDIAMNGADVEDDDGSRG